MLDWSKLFNIVSVAVAGALIVFFLVATIAVAVKGKRKCSAFDVILRILATLVFIASVGMLACSILTMLSGELCIVAGEVGGKATAVFVISGKATELPMAELFVLLSSNIGAELAVGLFICSLAALIVDCLVANKKADKKAKSKQAPQTKSAEQLKREAELERIRKIGESAVQKTNAAASVADGKVGEKPAQPEKEQTEEAATPQQHTDGASEDFDWRTERNTQENLEFVGIHDEQNDFDTFDDIEDGEERDAESDNDYAEQDREPTVDNAVDEADGFDEFEAEQEQEEERDRAQDEAADNAEYSDADYDAWLNNGNDTDEVADSYAEDEDSDNADDGDGVGAEQSEKARHDENIEPDREIYIPKMRTITKSNTPSAKKPVTRTKSASAKSQGNKTVKNKAPSGGAKRQAAKPSSRLNAKPAANRSSNNKKLPVTRRYIILDRRNAVNMFGEYLKERDTTEKDKLCSSINTIIIE